MGFQDHRVTLPGFCFGLCPEVTELVTAGVQVATLAPLHAVAVPKVSRGSTRP